MGKNKINSSDLIIGAYLKDQKGRWCRVKEIGIGGFHAPAINCVVTHLPNKPIKLNDKVLGMIGYKPTSKGYYYKYGYPTIYRSEKKFMISGGCLCIERFEYLHQLQMIVKAACGKGIVI